MQETTEKSRQKNWATTIIQHKWCERMTRKVRNEERLKQKRDNFFSRGKKEVRTALRITDFCIKCVHSQSKKKSRKKSYESSFHVHLCECHSKNNNDKQTKRKALKTEKVARNTEKKLEKIYPNIFMCTFFFLHSFRFILMAMSFAFSVIAHRVRHRARFRFATILFREGHFFLHRDASTEPIYDKNAKKGEQYHLFSLFFKRRDNSSHFDSPRTLRMECRQTRIGPLPFNASRTDNTTCLRRDSVTDVSDSAQSIEMTRTVNTVAGETERQTPPKDFIDSREQSSLIWKCGRILFGIFPQNFNQKNQNANYQCTGI